MFLSNDQMAGKNKTQDNSAPLLHKFILSEEKNAWFSGGISIHSCVFDVANYTDKLFEESGIFFPSDIKNSVIKRRSEFLAGRYCARESLRLFSNTSIDIHIGKHRNPLWPSHIAGSISHSDNHAVAVTTLKSNIKGIGIDIQAEIDRNTYLKIHKHILSGDENCILEQPNQKPQKLSLFSMAFSAKESFFKAAFVEAGRYFDFSCVSIMQLDLTNQKILMRVNETLSANLRSGTEITVEYQVLSDHKIITLVKLG